jgi:ubiquinone/menaquinone biosynthesis C-methylase UbiE
VNQQTHDGIIRHARLYELGAGLAFAGRRRRTYDTLVRAADIRPGHQVLDVGCGTGYLTRRAARAVGGTGAVTGLDPSPQMLDLARRLAPKCTFTVAEAERLPFDDGSFDRVVSCLAVHHIPANLRAEAAGQMFRVLRPGGRLLLADLGPPTGRRALHLFGAAHSRHHAGTDLSALVREAGFSSVETTRQRPWLTVVTARRAEVSPHYHETPC